MDSPPAQRTKISIFYAVEAQAINLPLFPLQRKTRYVLKGRMDPVLHPDSTPCVWAPTETHSAGERGPVVAEWLFSRVRAGAAWLVRIRKAGFLSYLGAEWLARGACVLRNKRARKVLTTVKCCRNSTRATCTEGDDVREPWPASFAMDGKPSAAGTCELETRSTRQTESRPPCVGGKLTHGVPWLGG